MTTIAVAEARRHFLRLLDNVSESHEPVHISRRRGGAVLVSEDDWRSIQETLHLLAIPGMRKSIIRGMKTPVRRCSRELKW